MHFSEIALYFLFFNLEVICRQANSRGKATLSVHLVLCTVNCAKVGYDALLSPVERFFAPLTYYL